jgi:TrpR-related protein YerC/YecD
MNPKHSKEAWEKELVLAFSVLKNGKETTGFLHDVLSDTELAAVAMRWQVITLLLQGWTERKIQKETGASTYLISRANQSVVKRGTGIAKVVWERVKSRQGKKLNHQSV